MFCVFLQILVNKFNAAIESQKPKVAQLEKDVETLNDDISALKAKVWTHTCTHARTHARTHACTITHTNI